MAVVASSAPRPFCSATSAWIEGDNHYYFAQKTESGDATKQRLDREGPVYGHCMSNEYRSTMLVSRSKRREPSGAGALHAPQTPVIGPSRRKTSSALPSWTRKRKTLGF